jgi:hypothetical protein
VNEAEKAIYTVSRSWFYKSRRSREGGTSPSRQRRAELDPNVADFHTASDGAYGAPRVLADLRRRHPGIAHVTTPFDIGASRSTTVVAGVNCCGLIPARS